ncbi:MAG TPA: Txe/YoeB family addiction module toxin [Acidobacteriota bacterium]|nr:Txe/YoeB family addiction module toxin [Acidobacteriota bacterium]
MKIIFSTQSWEDYLYWQKTNKRILKKINQLIKDICRDPYKGKGKPEPLRHALAGYWSRRINEEHRIVYKVREESLFIVQLRYHYGS